MSMMSIDVHERFPNCAPKRSRDDDRIQYGYESNFTAGLLNRERE
jgi:hypothetical protein